MQERYMFDHLFPTPEGLALGGIIVVERNPDGTLAIDGHEAEIIQRMLAVCGTPPDAHLWWTLRHVSKLIAQVPDEEMEKSMAEYKRFMREEKPKTFARFNA